MSVETISEEYSAEEIRQLKAENQELKARLAAYEKKMGMLEEFLIGPERYLAEDEFAVSDDIWTMVNHAIELAEESLSIAKAGDRADKTTKKDVARVLSRNRAVVQSVRTSQKAGSVDCDQVIEMARPDTRLEHRTILDAWDELEHEFGSFEVLKKDGRKILRCYTEDLTGTLVRAVRNDLSDPEFTESLNSWLASEGVE